MKAELRIKPHSVLPDETVVEIWWGGLFIGQVTGADGPGIRVVSKHPKEAKIVDGRGMVLEVRIDGSRELN
jgi:hypothetical protein